MKSIADISIIGMVIGYCSAIIIFFILTLKKAQIQKKFVISIFRMTVQLFILGYVLKYLFTINTSWFIFIMVLFMSISASQIIISNSKLSIKDFLPIISLVLFSVVSIACVFFVTFILDLGDDKIFSPQYIIPVSGMLLGNSMNGGVIAMKTMVKEIKDKRSLIEQKLSLGASPKESMKPIIRESYKLSLLPNLSSMAGMGMVSLPGMMTGQILSGVNPLVAVKYQLMIMLAIIFVVAINGFLLLNLVHKKFFNKEWQILIDR